MILKVFDRVFLDLFAPQLCVSSLQFGYQKGSSTTLATWTLTEAINYYVNRGSPVYLCLLDLTKAFDHVKLDKMFEKLSEKIPACFVRFFIHTYKYQQCYINWNNVRSSTFNTSNGVRQGAVASPIFFNIYLDELFTILKDSNIGCYIDNLYYGILGYADDLSLICPTREGLQQMINIVKNYCDIHGITISTNPDLAQSKTKCLIFNSNLKTVNLELYGTSLPWVESWKHLGHTIHRDESFDHDILIRRAEFIGKIHSLRQEVGQVDPKVFLNLTQIYFTSFYGSSLWNFTSDAALRLYATWNQMIRTTFNLPFGTHRCILKEFSGLPPLQEALQKRFLKFCDSLKMCGKAEVVHLFNKQKYDSRSTFGKNFKNILLYKTELRGYNTLTSDKWKVPLLKELLDVRKNNGVIENLTTEEVTSLITEIACK